MTKIKEQRPLKDVFEAVGSRAGYAMLLRQCGLKATSATLANWEKTNSVPAKWGPAIKLVSEKFGKGLPALKEVESFLTKEEYRKGLNDYSTHPLYAEMKRLYGSVDKFIKVMRLDHGVKLQRIEVYQWFKQGWVPRPSKGLMFGNGFSRESLGNIPGEAPSVPGKMLKVKKVSETEINPEDLF